jgi:hypothetical protein
MSRTTTLAFLLISVWIVGTESFTRSNGSLNGSSRRNRYSHYPHAVKKSLLQRWAYQQEQEDYFVTDSSHLKPQDRPSLVETLHNPRDGLALTLLSVGFAVSLCNILGNYNKEYIVLEQASIVLGLLSGLAAFAQDATGYKVNTTRVNRKGLANDRYVNLYGGLYSLAVTWLAARAMDTASDSWLIQLDSILPWIAMTIFIGSAVTPALTLFVPSSKAPPLSECELLRGRGLLGIGILGCIFAPECLSFALGSSDWWQRINQLHPSQTIVESSNALFALYATEASMIAHRCGKFGVAPFASIVPAFCAVCLLLAIAPSAAALYYMGNDISFFSFYRE